MMFIKKYLKRNERKAAILDDRYFSRRDPIVRNIIKQVIAGKPLEEAVRGFSAKKYGERVVEYPYFVNWLLGQKKGLDILDIGCVLNNELVADVLKERCGAVWLLNPVIEPKIFLRNPVYSHVAELKSAFQQGEQFPLVTSFSTIEHIGFDNSQYGYGKPAKYTAPTVEPLLESLRIISRLTDSTGSMLISVPFGFRETLIHPITGKISSQVFDAASVDEGVKLLEKEGVKVRVEVFQIMETGWEKVEAGSCNVKYADGCPGASAVVFINGEKP